MGRSVSWETKQNCSAMKSRCAIRGLSEMSREGIEGEIEAITGEEGDAPRSQELSQ
jgi:hypothetical protein